MKNIAIVINRLAGSCLNLDLAQKKNEFIQFFQNNYTAVHVYIVEPTEIQQLIQKLIASKTIDTLIVGGGDGTISSAASLLVDSGIVFGIFPLGTFNQFAQDLGIPVNLEQAMQVLTQGVVEAIDVGSVNGHFFLDKASVGIHPHAIEKREIYRKKLRINKVNAIIYALLDTVWRPPSLRIHLQLKGQEERIKTPFILIGNNRYEAIPLTFPKRRAFNEGHLSVFYTRHIKRQALFNMGLKTLVFGENFNNITELEQLWVEAVTIKSHKKRLKVAIDGEVKRLDSPLRFNIHPQSLRIIMPSQKQKIT